MAITSDAKTAHMHTKAPLIGLKNCTSWIGNTIFFSLHRVGAVVCIRYKKCWCTTSLFYFLFLRKKFDWTIIGTIIVVVIFVTFTLHAVGSINLWVGLAGGLSSVLLQTK